MISNGAVANIDYYTKEFMKDDYYNQSGNQEEGIGKWSGKGCIALGFKDEVKQKDFWQYLEGKNPNTGDKLNKFVRNNTEDYGQDFVLNANKDFTLLLNAYENNPEMKEKLLEVWDKANQHMIDEIEKRLTYRDSKGKYQNGMKAICATWQHQTSRSVDGLIDPHKHSHNVIGKYAVAKDGTFKAVDFKRVFEDKLLIGSECQEILAKGVQELGFELEEGKTGWHIKSFSDYLLKYFSHRGEKIKSEAKGDSYEE